MEDKKIYTIIIKGGYKYKGELLDVKMSWFGNLEWISLKQGNKNVKINAEFIEVVISDYVTRKKT